MFNNISGKRTQFNQSPITIILPFIKIKIYFSSLIKYLSDQISLKKTKISRVNWKLMTKSPETSLRSIRNTLQLRYCGSILKAFPITIPVPLKFITMVLTARSDKRDFRPGFNWLEYSNVVIV